MLLPTFNPFSPVDCTTELGARSQRDAEAEFVALVASAKDSVRQFRPGDLALSLGNGRPLAYIMLANPFATACVSVSRTVDTPPAVASAAFDCKTRSWERLLYSNGLNQCDLTFHLILLLSQQWAPGAPGVNAH